MIFAPRIQIKHVNNRLHALEYVRKNFQPTLSLTSNVNIEKKSFVSRSLPTRDDDNPRNNKDRNKDPSPNIFPSFLKKLLLAAAYQGTQVACRRASRARSAARRHGR
jgi:hypothetical protein